MQRRLLFFFFWRDFFHSGILNVPRIIHQKQAIDWRRVQSEIKDLC